MSVEKYNTNLAAEFYVLSMLHRRGADASLTLGNKKSVDITVVKGTGNTITIDVKGLAGITSWPVDNVKSNNARHFIVFVCFNKKMADPGAVPDVWVVPVVKVEPLTYVSPKGRRVVPRATLRKLGSKFKDAWHLIE